MNDTGLVVHDGHMVMLRRDVMRDLGLSHGQQIDEATFWKALEINCTRQLADLKGMRLVN